LKEINLFYSILFSRRVTWQVGLLLDGGKVDVLAGVEAVHVVDEEVVPVLHVDANQGLFGEGELGQPQVVQVAARDGWHVVSKQNKTFTGTVSRESL
jgi:hypothetical protein